MSDPRSTVPVRRLLAVVGLLAVFACGGGGSQPASQPTAPSTTNTTGEPNDADWTALAGELTANGVLTLNEALTAQGIAAAAVRPPVLFASLLQLQDEPSIEVRLDGLRFSGSYWCCGNLGPEPETVVSYSGEIQAVIGQSGRVLRVTETLSDSAPFRWGVPSIRTHAIELSPRGLQVVSDLVITEAGLERREEFRLVGTLTYVDGRGDSKAVDVNTVLGYENFFQGGAARVSGRMGDLNIPGSSYTPGASQRCSLPREGCGPLVEGNAPCTRYPACRR